MPRRRRQDKRRVPLAGEAGDLFVGTDGYHPVFDFDEVYSSPFEAKAAWEQCRVMSWQHPSRSLWPPVGAERWDDVGTRTRDVMPSSSSWRIEDVQEAVAADLASIAAFHAAHPDEAATVAAELSWYAQDLRMLETLAEQLGGRRDALGHPMSARRAWTAYEARAAGGDATGD